MILYILLAGYPPFSDESLPRLYRKITEGEYNTSDKVWDNVSEDAKDLIGKLLTVDPSKRISVEGIFQHPWMRDIEKGSTTGKPLLGTLQNFKSSVRFKKSLEI